MLSLQWIKSMMFCLAVVLLSSCERQAITPDSKNTNSSLIGKWSEHSIDTGERITFTSTNFVKAIWVDVLQYSQSGTYYTDGNKLYMYGLPNSTFSISGDTLKITTVASDGTITTVTYTREK